MKYKSRWMFLAASAGVLLPCVMTAAQNTGRRTDIASLLRLSNEYEARYHRDHTAALNWAAKNGVPERIERSDGGVAALMYLRQDHPVYYVTLNLNAADSVSADELWVGGSAGLSLDGSGVKLHIWDGGEIRLTHSEFDGRVTWADSTFPGPVSHSSHVSGTMIAEGQSPNAHGMANMATLEAYDFGGDSFEMAAAAAVGARASNHSYGLVAGWIFDGAGFGAGPGWYWFGDVNISTEEDPGMGWYSPGAQLWDQIAFDSPNYLIVNAAGNDRNDSHTGAHFHWDGGWVSSNDSHPKDGGIDGYESISYQSCAKNTLVVGAINDVLGGYSTATGVVMSTFSSWGPTNDGRIRPDVVANGINLRSCDDDSDSDYVFMSGTSMATPNVTGTVALLIQHWRQTHFPNVPLPAPGRADAVTSAGVGTGACCLPGCLCADNSSVADCAIIPGSTFLGEGTVCALTPCDCNGNNVCDSDEIAGGAGDCNGDGLLDECEIGFPCDMRSATIKALLIHTADETGPATGPDYAFGWGLINALTAADQISLDDAVNPWPIQEFTLNDGGTIEQTWTYSGTGPFKATICWTDPPGTPPAFVVDPGVKMLVNDLDLRIITPGATVVEPWTLDKAIPANPAVRGDNDVDNVEVVLLETPIPGDYTVRITHKGTLTGGSQDFSLILTGPEITKVVGCGACNLHGDVFPFDSGDPDGNPVGNCVVDIDDILTVLASFSAADHCAGFPNGVNTFGTGPFPCEQACTAGTVDIDDILSALAAFSGTFGCPHPCSPGACCFGDSTCQDGDGVGAGTTPDGGMSETTCGLAGGTYQGDGTTCNDVACP